jgi:HD superfamily phosphohydrolase
MIVFDPIYGRFRIPGYVSPLVLTPEVRRLAQIRLLNTITPSLATLGDLRRYSHTLGVLFLWSKLPHQPRDDRQMRALAASALLHDIGTPPFGHLFEYHLKESSGWTHEGIIRAVLRGTYAPENRAAQIFVGRTIRFRSALRTCGISTDLVEEIITGSNPHAKLLFGTIDLDNLDNVVRMAWALGIANAGLLASEIASQLSVDSSSRLLLPVAAQDTVRRWALLRRQVYEILVFDAPTVAAQAVLSQAISKAINLGILSEDDWYLSDEELLGRLRSSEDTKDAIAEAYLGKLPYMLCAIRVQGSLKSLGIENRSEAKSIVEQVIANSLGETKVLGYVFVDRGTFEKSLEFCDPSSGIEWNEGKTSSSVVLYAFANPSSLGSRYRLKTAVRSLIDRLAAPVMKCVVGDEGGDEQGSLDFQAQSD